MKVWRLPAAAPQASGKAMVNLLPLGKDEIITTILPLPEDESSWATLDVMFATNGGSAVKVAEAADDGEGVAHSTVKRWITRLDMRKDIDKSRADKFNPAQAAPWGVAASNKRAARQRTHTSKPA